MICIMKEQPLLYINVPWMKRYKGANEDDKPIGEFRFTREHQMDDHCQFNFAPYQKKVYGHVPGTTNPNLTKLGGARAAGSVDDVTVIWIATDPDSGGRVVVGWYQNARVWKTRQTPTGELARLRTTKESGGISEFSVEAPASISKCLLPGHRPRLKIDGSGPGQSPFWYGSESAHKQVRQLIAGEELIDGPAGESDATQTRGGWIQDANERRAIEFSAMDVVQRHYRENGYEVTNKCRENCGYDFLARSKAADLHLEVKGCKGNSVCVELTPNELAFAKQNHKTFHLCVVLDALKNKKLRVFRPEANAAQWCDESGNQLSTFERIAATIRE
jgi:hypothetical protein